MLLEAIKEIDLKDWRVIFIGPIETNFKNIIENFYKDNPLLIDKVKFIGNINDKSKLFEWYNRSKVFCLTSRSEGFPLVFPEAIYFGNYGDLGKIIEQDDIDSLAAELQKIINGQNDIGNKYQDIIEYSRDNFMWDKIVRRLYESL